MKHTALPASSAGIILLVGLAGHFASGAIYSSLEAREMIAALSSPALYLGSAIAGSAATTLALMLTLLGLVRRADAEFDVRMYWQIYRIAVLSTVLLGGAVVMLLLMTMPIGEFDDVPENWFPMLFKVLYWIVVVLSAGLVAMVTMLFGTVRSLIAKLTPHDDV
ncbi:hypothetical protein P8R33_04605 [Qipengyuania sp. XHP0211]|uniref:hypothetical protein n=1 Tax=Qipengyuania sp. XHP0211 TaxID=3038079 RepID=UPI00241E3C15|nr:hypothetical protein [Qipengyuania sp. XHP0211]MDG5750379.1 hypothetical protein [Qipengyuania sp. XHP0211]